MYKSVLTLVFLVVVVLLAFEEGAQAYRKPPFNGSIFGKRGNTAADFDAAAKALSSMCEIATEACSAWFPQNESNN